MHGGQVIVGVNYIISNQRRYFGTKKKLQAGYLWWQIMQFTLPEQSDWCDNMPLRLYNYAPVLPNVSRPYFSTRPQGAHENLVSGEGQRQEQRQSNHANFSVFHKAQNVRIP